MLELREDPIKFPAVAEIGRNAAAADGPAMAQTARSRCIARPARRLRSRLAMRVAPAPRPAPVRPRIP